MERIYQVVAVENLPGLKHMIGSEIWAEYWFADAEYWRAMWRYRSSKSRKHQREAEQAKHRRDRWERFLEFMDRGV